ncbi:MAG: DUF429 domain-containing protein [Xanthomonadales bacterium]|nr:DUF429 domain-containing protein [Xanthomonadales bacterium]
MAILAWRHYGDHEVAPLCRSWNGAIGAVADSDRLAREFVGGVRATSVFSAPIRAVLEASSRREASDAQSRVDGRGLAAQAFALFPKIRQWDHLLRTDESVRARVREVHPEVSFAAMRGGLGCGIAEPKRTVDGQRIRRDLLAERFGDATVDQLLRDVPKKLAAGDDVLDALAALWSAERIAAGTAQTLPSPVGIDSAGLVMAIWY